MNALKFAQELWRLKKLKEAEQNKEPKPENENILQEAST